MMLRSSTGLLGVALLALGCSAAGGEEEGAQQQASALYEPAAGETVLAEVNLGYGHAVFVSSRNELGQVSVDVMESAPIAYGETPFTKAVVEGHTTLELFQAVQPGRTAPEALVEAHAGEAKRLGRESTDVVAATVDLNAPIAKVTTTECDSIAFNPSLLTSSPGYEANFYFKSRLNNQTGGTADAPRTLNVGLNNVAALTWQEAYLVACNETNVTTKARMSYQLTGIDGTGWVNRGWATVQAGSVWKWRVSYHGRVDCQNEPLCDDDWTTQTYYRVQGYSAANKKFHLRGSEIRTTAIVR